MSGKWHRRLVIVLSTSTQQVYSLSSRRYSLAAHKASAPRIQRPSTREASVYEASGTLRPQKREVQAVYLMKESNNSWIRCSTMQHGIVLRTFVQIKTGGGASICCHLLFVGCLRGEASQVDLNGHKRPHRRVCCPSVFGDLLSSVSLSCTFSLVDFTVPATICSQSHAAAKDGCQCTAGTQRGQNDLSARVTTYASLQSHQCRFRPIAACTPAKVEPCRCRARSCGRITPDERRRLLRTSSRI